MSPLQQLFILEFDVFFFNLIWFYCLAPLFVCFLVQVQTKATNGRQIVELKMLSPEDGVCPGFAGGACIQHVIQTQLTIVTLLRRKVSSFDDPQLEHIVHTSAVVLEAKRAVLLRHQNSLFSFSMLFKQLSAYIGTKGLPLNWSSGLGYLVWFDGSLQIFNPLVSFWSRSAGKTFCPWIGGHLQGEGGRLKIVSHIFFTSQPDINDLCHCEHFANGLKS